MKYLYLLLLLLPLTGFTQSDLLVDTAVVEQQAAAYQQWMDDIGLGQSLKVDYLHVDEERLSLFLEFRYDDIDSVLVALDSLRLAFETRSIVSLEQGLFYKLLQLVPVDQSKASIQIADTYDPFLISYFKYQIHFHNGVVEVIKVKEGARSTKDTITIDPGSFKGMKVVRPAEIKRHYNKRFVLDTIHHYIQQKFGQQTCPVYQPKIHLRESIELLRIEADNLCKKVFPEEVNDLWCRILNRMRVPCNHMKRERLFFMITYQQTSEGIRIACEIDGYFTNADPSRATKVDYVHLEHADYKDFFERFADVFTDELHRMLLELK